MFIRLSITCLLLLATTNIFSQSPGTVSIEFVAGIGSYTPYSDFTRKIYLKQGSSLIGSTENIAEANVMPFAALHLNYVVSERISIVPFAQYQFHRGELFKNDITLFGITGSNPTPKTFRRSAENELNALTVGTSLRYTFRRRGKFQGFAGMGLAYMTRSHTYRELLEVNFSEQYEPLTINEEFTTAKKSALAIPLSTGVDYHISDQMAISLRVSGQFHATLEDVLGTVGLGFRRWL